MAEREGGIMDWDLLQRLMNCFPNSFINQYGEFIAHKEANEYFILNNCQNEMDVTCKILEWFSRGAYKTTPFRTNKKNDEFHKFMLNGINGFLGTGFTETDMETIYTYLGNAVHHKKTIEFVCSGYDLNVLKEKTHRISEKQ